MEKNKMVIMKKMMKYNQ